MKIFYRGYVISENRLAGPGCTIFGKRPERTTMTIEDTSRSAMRWIDREVIKHRVQAAGWLAPQSV